MATRKKETAKEKALKARREYEQARPAPRRAAAAAPAYDRLRLETAAPGQIGRASRSSMRGMYNRGRAIEGAKGMEPSGNTSAIRRRKAIAGVKSGASRKAWEALSPAQKRARLVDAGRGRSYRPASVMEADLRLESSKSFIRGMSAAQKRRTALAIAAEKKRQQARKAKKK
jgi:hypothetical protein